MQELIVGKMTRAWPLKPSVPPSIIGFKLSGVAVDHLDQGCIDPSSRFNTVQPTDDHFELHVVVFILVLDFTVIRRDLDPFDTRLHEGCSHFCFRFADVSLSKEELTVQVRDIDGVHVYDVDVLET